MGIKVSNLGKMTAIALILSLFLIGCKGNKNGKEVGDVKNITTIVEHEGKIDENTGLVYENEMELKHAEHFAVNYYKDGYKIITDASGRRILIVPRGKEVPEMKEKMPVVQQPIETVGLYSTIDASLLRPIGKLDRISSVTFEADKWRIPEIVERMENGDTVYVGKSSAIDYEMLQSVDPNLNLLSKSGEEDLFPKYDELGLDYISMGAYMEDDPRGRLEWVKLAAALFDKEKEAETFYEGELARINEIREKIAQSTEEKLNVAVVYFSPSKEIFYVNNSKGHQTVTTELAGGQPYPEGLTPEKRGSTAMTDEEFYKVMSDVDVLIYDNITGHGVQSIDDILEKADYLADMKVIKEGRVWGLQRDYWQSADKVADIIEDLHSILDTPHGEMIENRYYFLMKQIKNISK